MNSSASSPNVITRQNAIADSRVLASRTLCAFQPLTIPPATVASTPETCASSARMYAA